MRDREAFPMSVRVLSLALSSAARPESTACERLLRDLDTRMVSAVQAFLRPQGSDHSAEQ